jgi:hypothetical protein
MRVTRSRPRPYLLSSDNDRFSGGRVLYTGDLVRETGIYRVTHKKHRLPHEVVCLKGDRFPRCAKCSNAVHFDLIQAAEHLAHRQGCHLYELPVLDDEESETRPA